MSSSYAANISNNVVENLIVIPDLANDDVSVAEYCLTLGLEGTWIAASDSGFRYNYPGIGFHLTKARVSMARSSRRNRSRRGR